MRYGSGGCRLLEAFHRALDGRVAVQLAQAEGGQAASAKGRSDADGEEGVAAEIVGKGAMSGLRFADTETADRVQANLFRASIVAETSGRGHVLKLLPPLTMTVVEWKEIADTLVEVITDTVNASRILPIG
ncbi:hypothetical protein PV416_42395 [Streptomyces ipomoeae]|uniref:Uncharacterized protein n=1 Tax=Streptomyces ipomoeae 91-03 TaxID=698759 RepID=L1KR91_9ACTN|nr:hypothetical protein [Streptomyces ipomoeae]EKX63142.1 hypothetical protein STRIP9103_08556 [Streptomyces ipomoeae 91-03]MDX2700496.1 hypothetical protein [Streptomyces ipomoeae]MDX2827538.1 hypothetical protein [Streptomyces ipomoeae]MDX2846152.1 hypothetical protein [Streptomyces ipomoeae]MDX2880115.1 hypothetical protein [Streptomyces ipomoeae]